MGILLLQEKGVLGRVKAESSCGVIGHTQKTGLYPTSREKTYRQSEAALDLISNGQQRTPRLIVRRGNRLGNRCIIARLAIATCRHQQVRRSRGRPASPNHHSTYCFASHFLSAIRYVVAVGAPSVPPKFLQ